MVEELQGTFEVIDVEDISESDDEEFGVQQHNERPLNEAELELHELASPSLGSSVFTASTTNFEKHFHRQQYPGEIEEDKEPDIDIHGIQHDIDREDVFRKAVPKNYQVEQTLGRGHNGVVFSARETKPDGTQRKVAIKFLASRAQGHANRKMRELAAHTFLPPHPNIVELYMTARSDEGYEFFVMEHCEMSLDKWIKDCANERASSTRDGRLPPALQPLDTIRILHELSDAVSALRKVDIAHRDIKPANVLLSRRDDVGSSFPYSVKLADFGVADMKIGVDIAASYDVYMGASSSRQRSELEEYTAEDDFHAAMACVFFAWLGEPRWQEKAVRDNLHSDDTGFYHAVSQLRLDPLDNEIARLFSYILPIPLRAQAGEGFSLDVAMKEFENRGETWNVTPKLVRTPLDFEHVSRFEGNLNNAKLDLYATVALEIVSGRRKANDWKTARRFLDRARFYLKQFDGKAPDSCWCQYHFQSALVNDLPAAQNAVRSYVGSAGREDLSSLAFMREKTDAALRALEDRIDIGYSLIPENLAGWHGIGKAQFANMKGLWLLEEVKYYTANGNLKKAQERAIKGVEILSNSLNSFTDDAGEVYKSADEKVAFQHYRNVYLLRHETLKIAKLLGDDIKTRELSVEAVESCERGVRHAIRSTITSNGDRLEMRRCLAESLLVAGEHGRACAECKQIYEEHALDETSRARVLRVLAIWVASLRFLHDENPGDTSILLEMGLVCGLLTSRHRVAAATLVGNSSFVTNARAFLAPDRDSALKAAADPLYPLPLLPDNTCIRDHAWIALDTVERALEERGQSK